MVKEGDIHISNRPSQHAPNEQGRGKNPTGATACVRANCRGEFQQAAVAYERAIAADANFAPAHRNLGVVLDLYLGDSARALAELERYQELSGEEKPVSVWIAELRQRTGQKKLASPPPSTPSGDK